MRISRKLAALAAFFVVGGAVAGCGSSVSGNAVANVAGNPITVQAYNHWMYVAAKGQAAQAAQQGLTEPVIVSNSPTDFTSCMKAIRAGIAALRTASESTLKTDCKDVFTQDNNEVMAYLIQGYWIQAEAYKQGVRLSNFDSSFTKYLAKTYPGKTALANILKQSGQTKQDLRYSYRIEQLYLKLLKKYEKPVTNAAIASYYAAHKSSFGTPEMRDLHLIRTKSQAQAQAAYSALKSGQSWNTVAKTYAADAAAKTNGGVLSNVSPGEEESAVNAAIFGNPVNKLVGPIKGIFGYYVLQVTKVTPAVHESLAKATPSIKTTLKSQQQATAGTTISKQAKQHWLKKTTCRNAFAVATYCSNYKAPKTTSTPAVTPSTGSTTSTPSTSTTSTTSSTSTLTKTATTATKTGTTKSKG